MLCASFVRTRGIVPGLADRNGHRYTSEGTGSWGGLPQKNYVLEEGRWINPSISEIKNDRQLKIVSRFHSLRGSVIEDDI